ncbi:MAG: hypothetical protein IPO21_01320 [Bacteroidales bacterium]|nr:hypothetical protein [Bacteroidales bacterium]
MLVSISINNLIFNYPHVESVAISDTILISEAFPWQTVSFSIVIMGALPLMVTIIESFEIQLCVYYGK